MSKPPESKGKYLRSEVIIDEKGKVSCIKTVASNNYLVVCIRYTIFSFQNLFSHFPLNKPQA